MPSSQFTQQWRIRWLCFIAVLIVSLVMESLAQTTGKISGRAVDSRTGEPLSGVSIIIEGTRMGAATDAAGEYFIINVPPGTYRLHARMVGYEPVVIQGLVVSVNRTTTANFKLKEGVVEASEVVVTADRVQAKKDQTSSIRNVTSEQIKTLPVENLDQVVGLQAGVVRGHFRGGRSDEVAYFVDGVKVQEPYGLGRSVTVENDVISEIEVITGTFNAEYGNAMSGVVNAVTRDGGNKLRGSLSVNGSNFYTPHTDVFSGLKISHIEDVPRSKDYKLYLEGPVVQDVVTFLVNTRYQDNKGSRNGIRRFMPDNYSDWDSQDSTQWRSDHTGDNAIVPMETNTSITLFGKLSFRPLQTIRASLDYSYNYGEGQGYSHYYRYNPDGRATGYGRSHLLTATLNHTLSHSLFYEFKASYMKDWGASYVFENVFETLKSYTGGDSLNVIGLPVYRYVHDLYGIQGSAGPGFSTGGQDKGWSENWTEDYNLKFSGTCQLNKQHVFKAGIDFTKHNIDRFNTTIQNYYRNTPYENDFQDDSITGKRIYLYYKPDLVLERSTYTDIYVVRPWEYSGYVQDKMEFENMVINLGVRYDYFNPNTTYPSEPRNPGNDLTFPNNPERMSTYLQVPASSQISPRFGISYKLGDAALLRFSYGHFFQMPPLYALYTDNSRVVAGDYQTLMGNPLVKPQKTVQYEAGLWQQLTREMSFEVAVFYRDIYNLLSTKTIETFNAIHYGLYSNKDYGNARGLELKYDYFSGNFSAGINYTLQYTRGNANYPSYTFSREGSRLDPVNVLIPMDWDQRHTFNASLSYYTEGYGGSITGRFDSGTPYSWSPLPESPQALVNLQPNNSSQPTLFSIDLSAFVNLWTIGTARSRLTLLVYNLLDGLNEVGVNATTGRANQQIVRETDLASYRSNFSTIYDLINNPSSFTNPRSVKVGIEVMF
jgi:outer membrane receptor protein involved in Fe transport